MNKKKIQEAVEHINNIAAGTAIKQSRDKIIEQLKSGDDNINGIAHGFTGVINRRFKDKFELSELLLILEGL